MTPLRASAAEWGGEPVRTEHEGQAAGGHAAARRPELRPLRGLHARAQRRRRRRRGAQPAGQGDVDRRPRRQWTDRLSPPYVVFAGGPVEVDALIALASADGPDDDAWSNLHAGIGTVDLSVEPDDVAASVSRLRIFRGYAGWGGGQLEDELAAGAWMVLDADADDLFTAEPVQPVARPCCAARAAGPPGWPTPPTTSRTTERRGSRPRQTVAVTPAADPWVRNAWHLLEHVNACPTSPRVPRGAQGARTARLLDGLLRLPRSTVRRRRRRRSWRPRSSTSRRHAIDAALPEAWQLASPDGGARRTPDVGGGGAAPPRPGHRARRRPAGRRCSNRSSPRRRAAGRPLFAANQALASRTIRSSGCGRRARRRASTAATATSQRSSPPTSTAARHSCCSPPRSATRPATCCASRAGWTDDEWAGGGRAAGRRAACSMRRRRPHRRRRRRARRGRAGHRRRRRPPVRAARGDTRGARPPWPPPSPATLRDSATITYPNPMGLPPPT